MEATENDLAGQVRIRAARPGDEPVIGLLSYRAASEAAPPWTTLHSVEEETAWAKQVIAESDPAKALLVAVDGEDEVLGFVAALAVTDLSGHEHGHISSIAVMPGVEGRGIGRRLIAAAEAWARNRGYGDMTMHVYVTNDRARQLYERSGYEPEWYRMRKNLS